MGSGSLTLSQPPQSEYIWMLYGMSAVYRADLHYHATCGFSKAAFAKLKTSRFISFDHFARRAFQRLTFCNKALTTLVSGDVPCIFILGRFFSLLSRSQPGVPREFRREQTGPFPLQMLGTSRQTELLQRAQGVAEPSPGPWPVRQRLPT